MTGSGRSTRAPAALAGWTGLVLVALLVLHSASGALAAPPLTSARRWQAWLVHREPVVIAFALARLAGLAVAWYLLAVTVVGATLRVCRARRLAELADKVTVSAVRRLLATTMTMSLATSGLGALSAAAQAPGPAGPPATEPAQPLPTITMHRLPDLDRTAEPVAPSAEVAPDASRGDGQGPADGRWEVAPGDCLWSISEAILARAWGRTPSEEEVAPYWRRMIETNRAALADENNPDLIFPGQVFAVPPPPGASGLAHTV